MTSITQEQAGVSTRRAAASLLEEANSIVEALSLRTDAGRRLAEQEAGGAANPSMLNELRRDEPQAAPAELNATLKA